MSQSATGLAASLASAERALQVLDRQPEIQEKLHPRPIARAKGHLEIRNVTFSYPDGAPVLRDVTLAVPAGTRVGLQGRTGAGKSTLLSLLMRFYDPDRGVILLDGVDLRDYRLTDLREQFALVLQDSVLLSTTVRENIAYGRSRASDAEIEEAARLANAHEFIVRLPDGYQTEVGERGLLLSGGERQRIALARAFLRDAPILILDEPTSAVDVATEAAILEAVQRLMRDRTTFVITHRLSALEGCDLQLVLENGDLRELRPAEAPAFAARSGPSRFAAER
jgi:ATP-binding cassette subfamily B protein